MNTEIDRKIAVIFATDVVGYSKHMEANESETVKNLRACEKLLREAFDKHKGRLFNTGGDSFLAEFPSAVSAVECAVEFQGAIKQRNASDNTTVKLEFRIGINSGDVIKEKDNFLGDGVNIAARLEALAQPNGITISKVIYDFVRGKTQFEFNDIGIQKIKQNEFHAFDVLLDPSQKRTSRTNSKSITAILGAIAALLVVGLLSFIFLFDNGQKVKKISGSSKPVILVMPIKSSGLTENQKGFANGVTESMIATLSGYDAIKVLSSSTSLHAEKTKMMNEAIRDQFGVNYLVRGSMQVIGNSARLNLEITDLESSEVSVSEKKDFNFCLLYTSDAADE